MLKDIKNRIIDEYEELRTKAEAERQVRIKDAFKICPKLSDIQKEINILGLDNTKAIMKNPEKAKDLNSEFNKKLSEILNLKSRLISENNIDPDFDKIKYSCQRCNDTGFENNGKKCICFRDKLIKNTYKISNLSDVMKDMTFENFSFEYYGNSEENGISERENIEFIYDSAKKFCKNFDSYKRNILFYGAPGLGKTFISSAIAREMIEKEKTVIYVSASKLFSGYDDYKFGRADDLEDFFEDIYNSDLLIIDDLGTEYISKLSVPFLFDLVNDRILKEKKIIINTNLLPNELEKNYSLRFMSRIYEYFDVFKFFGKDIRIQKQYR